jgi:anti-sigma regulatory factor (Ser/Thr protein kinase)
MLTIRRSAVSLHRTPTAPRAARRYLEHVVDRPEDVVSLAKLLVTELVSNSVRHAGAIDHDHIEVRVDIDDERLRIEVHDEGAGSAGALEPPRRSTHDLEPNEGGFGLLFVDSLADRWGSERGPGGTTVWFELDRRGTDR